jgi:hypothetical protein
VQYKGGAPIKAGVRIIRFEPAPDTTATVRRTASSDIAPDGSFTLFSRKPGDGVPLGKYIVTFTIISSPTGGENLIKPEYMSPSESPYEVEVKDDMSGLLYEVVPK